MTDRWPELETAKDGILCERHGVELREMTSSEIHHLIRRLRVEHNAAVTRELAEHERMISDIRNGTCSRHPRYQAKRPPKADCWPCRRMWAARKERKLPPKDSRLDVPKVGRRRPIAKEETVLPRDPSESKGLASRMIPSHVCTADDCCTPEERRRQNERDEKEWEKRERKRKLP